MWTAPEQMRQLLSVVRTLNMLRNLPTLAASCVTKTTLKQTSTTESAKLAESSRKNLVINSDQTQAENPAGQYNYYRSHDKCQ